MTISQFAEKYRLKITRESSGDEQGDYKIIQGRLYKDANISEHDGGRLACCWLTKESRTAKFNSVKRECLQAGMTVAQEGDNEAIFLFDPENDLQAKLAIKSVKAKVRRQLTPERIARQVANLQSFRFRPQENALSGV